MKKDIDTNEDQPKPKPKVAGHKAMYYIIAGLLLVFGSGSWLIYNWQHQQTIGLKAELQASNQRVADTLKDLKEQTKKYNELKAKAEAEKPPATSDPAEKEIPTQKDLDLKVLEATTFSSGAHFVSIAITLTNETESDISISKSAYELKDQDNHVYTSPQGAYLNLGPRYATLPDTVISPGETVAGGFTFNITSENILNYTLTIGDHSYAVKAKLLGT